MKTYNKGDKITIEGLNVTPDGYMYFNKPKKTGRKKPTTKLVVTEVFEGDSSIKRVISESI